MKKAAIAGSLLLLWGIAPAALADQIFLVDSIYYVNGISYSAGELPIFDVTVDSNPPDAFSPLGSSGLGTLTLTFAPGSLFSGTNTVIAMLNHDILALAPPYDTVNNNEYGTVVGTAAAGQIWEIDQYDLGDIVGNTFFGFLDGANGAPQSTSSQVAPYSHDVAMALGWNFNPVDDGFGFNANQVTITFNTSLLPGGGTNVKFSSTFADGGTAIGGGQNDLYLVQTDPIPEPGSWMLLGIGLAMLSSPRLLRRRR